MTTCGNVICAQMMRCLDPSSCGKTYESNPANIDLMPNFTLPKTTTIPSSTNDNNGWVCPKCSSVWAPYVPGCFTCNKSTPTDIKSTMT